LVKVDKYFLLELKVVKVHGLMIPINKMDSESY